MTDLTIYKPGTDAMLRSGTLVTITDVTISKGTNNGYRVYYKIFWQNGNDCKDYWVEDYLIKPKDDSIKTQIGFRV